MTSTLSSRTCTANFGSLTSSAGQVVYPSLVAKPQRLTPPSCRLGDAITATTRTPHCSSDCNVRIPAASSPIRMTFMPATKLLTLPQLFRYEHAQRSDNRHLL